MTTGDKCRWSTSTIHTHVHSTMHVYTKTCQLVRDECGRWVLHGIRVPWIHSLQSKKLRPHDLLTIDKVTISDGAEVALTNSTHWGGCIMWHYDWLVYSGVTYPCTSTRHHTHTPTVLHTTYVPVCQLQSPLHSVQWSNAGQEVSVGFSTQGWREQGTRVSSGLNHQRHQPIGIELLHVHWYV